MTPAHCTPAVLPTNSGRWSSRCCRYRGGAGPLAPATPCQRVLDTIWYVLRTGVCLAPGSPWPGLACRVPLLWILDPPRGVGRHPRCATRPGPHRGRA